MFKSSLQPAAHAAAVAYRRDMAHRSPSDPFSADDGGWIAVASLLGHAAAHARDVPDADALLSDAADLATTILGVARTDRTDLMDVANRSGSPDQSVSHRIVIPRLVEHVENAGAFHLAATMYESLSIADPRLPALERGRLLAMLARVYRKLGRLDESAALYTQVARLARTKGEPELDARAHIGFAALAQARGDFDAVRRNSQRAARIARRGNHPALLRMAYQGLMLAATNAENYSLGLHYGWYIYELAMDDAIARDDALTNIGQLLADTGNHAAARAAFATVLTRSQPARIGLPALGGLAVSSAHLRDDDTLTWAADQLLREVDRINQPYEIAHALIECALALNSVGQPARAEQCRREALALARAFDFGQLLDRAERLDTAPADAGAKLVVGELGPRARGIARRIEALNPRRLPENVDLRAVA